MNSIQIFHKQKDGQKNIGKLFPHEWSMIAYLAFTLCFMAIMAGELVSPIEMVKTRVIAVVVLIASWLLYNWRPTVLTQYIRIACVMMTLTIWYPDTYEMNRLFPSLDHVFARWDEAWFGCQPSLLFSQKLPQWWASELFCLGYFSYFPMMYIMVTWFAFRQTKDVFHVAFVIFTSFFLYYLIYIFVPVAGPQFYYQAEGVDVVVGVFPDVGNYFRTHQEMYPMPGGKGPFHYMVEMTQAAGERPTAAFPSSHIGVSTIMLLLWMRYRKPIGLLCYLPFYLLLCGATVYIHAHYLVDAIFGFLSAFVVYFIANKLYRLCSSHCSPLC